MKQSTAPSNTIVSAQWLDKHLHDKQLKIIDASWHMPSTGRNAENEYAAAHIKGAVFFDIEKFSAASDLPHMLPSVGEFSEASSALGISNGDVIVVYDTTGIFSAARVWWMYRYFGANQVHVLDGGLPAWKAIGGALSSGTEDRTHCDYSSTASHGAVADATVVLNASNSGSSQILDARSHARFTGAEKEVRPGLRSGHIPGSSSLPFTTLLNNGYLRNPEELANIFKTRGIDIEQPIITTCGSGVTAAIIILALEVLGVHHAVLYDGSWSEWGALPSVPVDTG